MSRETPGVKPLDRLKELALRNDPAFFEALREETRGARGCAEILRLSALRKKAALSGLTRAAQTMRIALVGGYTLYPLNELIGHFLAAAFPTSWRAEFLLGDFDNYTAEILDESSRLYAFRPEVIAFLPSHRRCQASDGLPGGREWYEAEARNRAAEILELCRTAHGRSGAEVILANFPLPGRHDPGPYRTRTAGSTWSFRKLVNLELGLNAPAAVHMCDVEFLAARRGTLEAWDARAWFESKQPYASGLLLDVAREIAHIVSRLHQGPKKVAVVDLDNTLWGGVIGDDGWEGIDIGGGSPRGEAFQAFQEYLKSLTERGVLLAVCSKNDFEKAVEPFQKHPGMILRMKDFAAFEANWQPKPENLRRIAAALNVGLDSLVFLDDEPAEIEMMRQFAPEVECLPLGADPAGYVALCEDARWFEPAGLTAEDRARADQYRQVAEREELLAHVTDMDAYLASLGMEASIREFRPVDVARIAQLINKSNQFNLTARRRTEAQVEAVMADPAYFGITVRLADRFGDYGLIAVAIGEAHGEEAEIDTWVMSCRALNRQVEDEVMNHIVCAARRRGCRRIRGVYVPTARNGMVRTHYADFGFAPAGVSEGRLEFTLEAASYAPKATRIRIAERPYDAR